MKPLRIIALAAVIGLILARSAYAQFQFVTTSFTIDQAFEESFVAGYANFEDMVLGQNATGGIISIVEGGLLQRSAAAMGSSTVNMSGGRVLLGIGASDNGAVNLSGGHTESIGADRQGTASMSGGIANALTVQNNGTASVTGGQILASIQLRDSGKATIDGVSIGELRDGQLRHNGIRLFNQSTLELADLTLGTGPGPEGVSLEAFETSTARLTGTTVLADLRAAGQNTFEISRSTINGGLTAFNLTVDQSTVGGAIAVLGAGANGSVGTSQANSLSVRNGGILSVSGSTIVGGGSAEIGGTLTAASTQFGGSLSVFGGTLSATSTEITGDLVASAAPSMPGSITLTGGGVTGHVIANGGNTANPTATISITGANVGKNVMASNAAAVTLNSVDVVGDVTTTSPSGIGALSIQGGTITGNVVLTSPGQVTLSGTTFMKDVQAAGFGVANLSDVTVKGDLLLFLSTATLSSGTIEGEGRFGGNSFTMTGGTIIKDVSASGANFTMQAGTLAANLTIPTGNATISGGTIGGDITVTRDFLPTNATITGGNVGGDIIVGGEDLFGVATLTMSGGQVTGTLGVQGQNIANVSGGSITGVGGATGNATINVSGTAIFQDQLNAFANSTINFSGGGAKSVGVADQATLNMSASAFIVEGLTVLNGGIANLNGGKVTGDLKGNDSSVIVMGGGEVFNAVTKEGSTLVVQGGTIRGSLLAQDSSVVRLIGGSVSGQATARQNSTILVGGTASVGDQLAAFETSTVTIEGGSISGIAVASNDATINVRGSAVITGDLQTNGGGRINMSGGSVQGDLSIVSNGKLVLSSGTVAGKLLGTQNADIVMTGGTVGEIEANLSRGAGSFTVGGGQVSGDVTAFNDSGLLLVGGAVSGVVRAQENSTVEIESVAAIAGTLTAFGSSTVNMRGGTVGVGLSPADLEATANSTVNLSGGTVGRNLEGFNNATINMSGGTVFGRGVFSDGSRFNVTGGKILGGIQVPAPSPDAAFIPAPGPEPPPLAVTAFDNATINIIGFDLVSTLLDPNFEGMFSQYQLAGRLPDGTLINGGTLLVQNQSQASFHLLTPEPGDIDVDLDVDAADLALFAQHLGTASGSLWITGDFNADGMTTLHDLALLQTNLSAISPNPAAAPVPEPATGLLLGFAAIVFLIRRASPS